ncbi:MAG: helix-turn-helix domain-containing protein [Magnetococcus sp. YQC-3]
MKGEAEPFMTTPEAARLLGVNARTIQNWVEKGLLHAWKTAGGIVGSLWPPWKFFCGNVRRFLSRWRGVLRLGARRMGYGY